MEKKMAKPTKGKMNEENTSRDIVSMRENWAHMVEAVRQLQVLTTKVGQQHLQDGQQGNVKNMRTAVNAALEEGIRIYQYLIDAEIVEPPKPVPKYGYESVDDIPVRKAD